ncbi:hypothetical protein LTV02_07160 [Nocardia yamanashiensis]|uniref:hypothetical protein n=1 Tax=Nocardia yamanashiensis TaxID=209247 RepID=UPI001E623090|nr:hypothetical protein [Nocardia yamanashiensis]UGT43162.1 hypothetical protein LTV02_07160 [Nocardia yamanashiensis]
MLTVLFLALASWSALTAATGYALSDPAPKSSAAQSVFTTRDRIFPRIPVCNLHRLHGRHRA